MELEVVVVLMEKAPEPVILEKDGKVMMPEKEPEMVSDCEVVAQERETETAVLENNCEAVMLEMEYEMESETY